MANQETENEQPVTTAKETATTADFDELKKKKLRFRKKAYEAANASLAPTTNTLRTIELPQLRETNETGYTNGVKKPIICCYIGPHRVEKNTAYDFLLMANVAAKEGISLKITSAFRTNEEQTRLYIERKNPAVAKEKGTAAVPGYSNHQSGIAIDINVGMRKSDFINRNYTPTFIWLQDNAAKFGFDHVEGAGVKEPWHWTHLEPRIVGIKAFETQTNTTVVTVNTAINAAASGQSGTLRMTNLVGHDETVAFVRSETMCRAQRQTKMTEWAIFNSNQSLFVGSRISQLESAKLTLEEDPPGFDVETLDSLVYDFDAGTWGDGRTV